MSEQVITTKRGVYGRVQITLPLDIKNRMLDWAKKSGMKRTEFLRMALVSGYVQLATGIGTGEPDPNDPEAVAASGQPARKR